MSIHDPAASDSPYQSIFNALAYPIFIVDSDVRIRDLNAAAMEKFGLDGLLVLDRRGGEVLHCLHATDVPEGCGHGPLCDTCMIRGSVNQCLRTKGVVRRRAKAEILANGDVVHAELLVTASPLPGPETLVVLTVEDIAEISKLKAFLTVCMHCKEIQSEVRGWQAADAYFSETLGVDFSHGICPKCLNEKYPDPKRP